MNELLLLAASGLAREVLSTDQGDYRIVGILDDDALLRGEWIGGVEVLGGIDRAVDGDESLLVCVGAGRGRRKVVDRLASLGVRADRYAIIVDSSVRVPESCVIGAGSILLSNVVLTADVVVGRHVVAMPHVTLTHDDVVGDFATLAAGVTLGGSVTVGAASYLGMNASVRQRVTVGAGVTIGMGAVVLGDVPDGETWAGVPARRLAAPAGASR